MPPDKLESEQVDMEQKILDSQTWKEIDQNTIKIFLGDLKAEVSRQNYPPEAFTDDALYWSYVVYKNREYQHAIQTEPALIVQRTVHTTGLDLSLITNALPADQIKKANAWKIAYLRRLRSQHVDQSYIKGYLQAWNLSSNDVFGSGN